MKNTVKSLFALLMLVSFTMPGMAQENENVKQERTVEEFSAIQMDQPCKMIVSQGDPQSVIIEGQKDIVDAVKVHVKNGVFLIESGDKGFAGIIVHVTAKNLESLEVSGAAVMESATELKSEKLEIEAEGAASVDLELNVADLESEVSGAAQVKLRGMAQVNNAEVSGAATYSASGLQTKNTNIEVSGASNADIDATEGLTGEVSGAGTLHNKSQAQNTRVEQTGAGSFNTDTTSIKLGDNEITFEGDFPSGKEHFSGFHRKNKEKVSPQWMGVELGLNSYMNKDFGFDIGDGNGFFEPQVGRSMNVGLNVFEIGVPLVKNHMTLVTGLGFELNNYYYKNNFVMIPDTSEFLAYNVPGEKFNKNKLTLSWIRVPLLLQFDSNPDKKGSTFHFSMGMIGSLKLCSHTKQTWDFEETRYRTLTRDDFNLSPFKADATVRIGYGYLNLFVNYSVNSMFRKGAGPELFPVSAGITLVNI